MDPQKSLHEVTQQYHKEAYPDLNALRNDPGNHPFDPNTAEATGDVTKVKAVDVAQHLDSWNVDQEIARGTAKDISTKLIPLLEAQGATPDAIARAQDLQAFLKDVGNGAYPPPSPTR